MSSSNFVDYVKVCCRSGKGGAGSKHFHRDRTTAKGGPDGGDGGRGGHIILKGDQQIWTLLNLKFRKHIIAAPGESGGANLSSGKNGKDDSTISSLYLNALQLRINETIAIGPKEKPKHNYPEIALLEMGKIVIKPLIINS